MVIAYTGDKGEPEAVASGSSPSFAADLTEIMAWVQAGRSFRKVATIAALSSATGMADDDIAQVDNVDGAWFRYSSSAGAWTMYGTPVFADSSARSTAIPSPVTGMRSRITGTTPVDFYSGSAWLREDGRIVPSAATNGTVTAGVVTSTAQSIVRVRDAFPSGFTVFKVVFDVTMSAAVGVNMRLAVDGTDSSTGYDTQRGAFQGASPGAAQNLNGAEWVASNIAIAGARHFGEILITDANVAGPTVATFDVLGTVTAAMTSSAGRVAGGGDHRTSTAYNSFSLIPSSGTITVNRLTVHAVS